MNDRLLINYCDPAWGVKHNVEWYLEMLKAHHFFPVVSVSGLGEGLLADRHYYYNFVNFFFCFSFSKTLK